MNTQQTVRKPRISGEVTPERFAKSGVVLRRVGRDCLECGSIFVRPKQASGGKYCSIPCAVKARVRQSARPIMERFEANVFPEPNSGCHPWMGFVRPNGYGTIHLDRKREYAHRVSWRIHRGEIPHGLFVLHKCDVRCCVNPDHLFLGTAADNAADMVAKGRDRRPLPKLTASQVGEIRARVAGGVVQASLAREYGVSKATVCLIVSRQKWSQA
jgi:hypothetical protein